MTNLPNLFAALWALVLLGAYFAVPRLVSANRTPYVKYGWQAVLLVALIVRLVPSFLLTTSNYDTESYQAVGELVLNRQDVYSSPEVENRHPYLPLEMYWSAFAVWGAKRFGFPFVPLARLLPILADVAIALLIYLRFKRGANPAGALSAGLGYAVNPIPVYVSAYHGQFDAVPALFTLLACFGSERSASAAGGWLGLGILTKSWPILAFPSLWSNSRGWRNKTILSGWVVFIPLLGIGVYLLAFNGNLGNLLGTALGYNRGVGVWGYVYLSRLLSILKPAISQPFVFLARYGRLFTLALLGLVYWLRVRKELPLAGVLTTLVGFYALTHAFAIQYLMWVVPFAILEEDDRWLGRFTLGAFAYMFLAYHTLILDMRITSWMPWPQADWLIIMPAGLPAWLVSLGWLVSRLRGDRLAVNHPAAAV